MTGRIKVELVDANGKPTNPDIGTSKKRLLNAIADKIPEALVQYEDTLALQKESLRKRHEEMLKMKAEMEGKDPKALASGDGEDKKKKKKSKK